MIDRGTVEIYTVDGDGLALDLILWRRYRRPTPGLAEAVLDMNQGLAAQGPFIARGTALQIPLDTPTAPSEIAVVQLW